MAAIFVSNPGVTSCVSSEMCFPLTTVDVQSVSSEMCSSLTIVEVQLIDGEICVRVLLPLSTEHTNARRSFLEV